MYIISFLLNQIKFVNDDQSNLLNSICNVFNKHHWENEYWYTYLDQTESRFYGDEWDEDGYLISKHHMPQEYPDEILSLCNEIVVEIEPYLTIENFEELHKASMRVRELIESDDRSHPQSAELSNKDIDKGIMLAEKNIDKLRDKKEKLLQPKKVRRVKNLPQQLTKIDKDIASQHLVIQKLELTRYEVRDYWNKYGNSDAILKFNDANLSQLEDIPLFIDKIKYGTFNLSEKINEIERYDDSTNNAGLFAIFGDPGWGKTIQFQFHLSGFFQFVL